MQRSSGADGGVPGMRKPTTPGRAEPPDTAKAPDVVLTLFVADRTPGSLRAWRQIETWLDLRGAESVSFEVVNVQERPDLAERERVPATPTLLRHGPPPRGKLVGGLADWEAVVRDLDLAEDPAG